MFFIDQIYNSRMFLRVLNVSFITSLKCLCLRNKININLSILIRKYMAHLYVRFYNQKQARDYFFLAIIYLDFIGHLFLYILNYLIQIKFYIGSEGEMVDKS